MESSVLFPPLKSPLYTKSTSTHEPNAISDDDDDGASKRSRQPLPPLYIPPGHVAFRLLCHASRIGGLIGKSGFIIKQLQQLTNSYIRVEDPPHSSDHRAISVISSPATVKKIKLSALALKDEEGNNGGSTIGSDGDEECFDVSAAQEGIVRVFERVVEVAAEGDAVAGIGGVISCRLLVSKSQGGAVIGKGGKVVEKIRKDTGCRIKVLPVENIYSGSLPMEEIVEIEGVGLAVKKALVAITGRLQEFPPIEKTRTRESESLSIQTEDLPQQQTQIAQPTEASNMNSRAPQQLVVFKILCPNERVGSIIGKGGCIIKTLQNETGALISVGPTLTDCDERVITITAMERVESEYSVAQKATIAVFNRFMEDGLVKGLYSNSKGPHVSARVLVPTHHVGCLLGKGGAIISEMRKVTGTGLRIYGGNQVPKCVSENNEVLQITGEFVNVQDALYKATGRLRENIFSITMLTGNGSRNSSRTEDGAYGRVRDHPPFESHLSAGISNNGNDHKSLTQSMDHLSISSTRDQLPFSSVSMEDGSIMANGGILASAMGAEHGSGSRKAIVTNTTVEIIVPGDVIGSIYGENGSNLTTLQQISGAKVVVNEPQPGTIERVVVISGTTNETQAAQSLLQAFVLSGL